MISQQQKQLAKTFKELHHSKNILILPNVWNIGSAYVFAKEGASALATSSAGMAYDLGYPDGEDISFEDLLFMVEKICQRVAVPVSVDFERGYAESGEAVKENARRLLEAGAVGLNIEDGKSDGSLSSLELQKEKITALVELKEELGLDFVINARTCAYWYQVGSEKEMLAMALERGRVFAEAGADCVFVPGPLSMEAVRTLAADIPAPLNIIANKRSGSIADLQQAGVSRLSLGSGPVRYIYKETIAMAREIQNGQLEKILDNPFIYGKANDYFSNK